MDNETKNIMYKVKSLGLNCVGCKVKKYAHRKVFTLFLKEDMDNRQMMEILKIDGFDLVFDFVQENQFGYRHDANKIIDVQFGG